MINTAQADADGILAALRGTRSLESAVNASLDYISQWNLQPGEALYNRVRAMSNEAMQSRGLPSYVSTALAALD